MDSRVFLPGWGAPAALYTPGLPASWSVLEPPSFAASGGSFTSYRRWLELELRGRGRSRLAGHSMGGALAILAAAEMPELVERLVLIAPAGLPLDKPIRHSLRDFLRQLGSGDYPKRTGLAALIALGRAPRSALGKQLGAALRGEDALRPYLEALRPELRSVTPEGMVSALGSVLPDVDRAVLTDEFGEDEATSFREAVRVGIDGWLDDDLAFVRPWGFDLAEVRVPTSLWQGSEDLMVPFAHGEWFEAHLPQATVHLLPGEGHLSVGLGALDTMLDELVAAAG